MEPEQVTANAALYRWLSDTALRGARESDSVLVAEAALSLRACGLPAYDMLQKIHWTSSTEDELINSAIASRPKLERRDERVAYELHRMIALKLPEHEGEIRQRAWANLSKMLLKRRNEIAHGWLAEWQRLLDAPLAVLVEGILDDSELASEMRQLSPFAGALSEDERALAIQKARAVATL